MSQFSLARALAAACAAFAVATPSAAVAAAGEVGCADVDVIVVRGSGEPSGSSLALDGSGGVNGATGVWTYIRKELQTPTDGSTPIGQIVRTDVDYPADLPFPSSGQGEVADSAVFRRSVRLGTFRVITYLNEQNARCPNKRFVLLGYSQGAIVAANAITPDLSKRVWIDNVTIPTLNASASSRVTAVGLFADVGFNQANGWATHDSTIFGTSAPAYLRDTYDDLNRGWNDGSSSHITTAPQVRDATALVGHLKKVRSYCIKDDFICQGTGGLAQHLYYMDANKPAPRRNLAIFAIQQLRNEFDKTYAGVQCTITSAPESAVVGMTETFTMRFQGTVDDRATVGTNSTTTNLRSTLSFGFNEASLLKAALGNASAIARLQVWSPLESRRGGVWQQSASYSAYTDATYPLTGGFSASLPGGSQAGTTKTVTWTNGSAGTNDLSLSSDLYVRADAQGGGTAWLSCDLGNLPASQFAGRQFGRIVAE